MTLLERIEKHLKDHHISATRFGRRAVGDPRFVLDLRMGRRPRRRTIETRRFDRSRCGRFRGVRSAPTGE